MTVQQLPFRDTREPPSLNIPKKKNIIIIIIIIKKRTKRYEKSIGRNRPSHPTLSDTTAAAAATTQRIFLPSVGTYIYCKRDGSCNYTRGQLRRRRGSACAWVCRQRRGGRDDGRSGKMRRSRRREEKKLLVCAGMCPPPTIFLYSSPSKGEMTTAAAAAAVLYNIRVACAYTYTRTSSVCVCMTSQPRVTAACCGIKAKKIIIIINK